MEECTSEDGQNATGEQDISSHLKRRLVERRKSSFYERLLRISITERALETIPQSPPSLLRSFSKPLDKFKHISRLLGKMHMAWKELALRAKKHLSGRYEELLSNAKIDPTLNVNPKGITELERTSLRKKLSERTSEDYEILKHLVEGNDAFKKFFGIDADLLSRLVYLESYKKGSVIVQQGYPGVGFYYVISGLVCVVTQTRRQKELWIRQHADGTPYTWEDEWRTAIDGYIKPGESFGELALLLKSLRKATIVCVTDTEVVRIDQDDFEHLLHENSENEWAVKTTYIKSHPLFSTWSASSISDAIEQSHICKYGQNSVVLSDLCNNTDYIYFVMSGGCKVAYEVQMCEEVLKNGFVRLSLISNRDTNNSSKQKKIIKKFWHVGNLLPGDHFGLGEGSNDTYIIADTKTECLLVNSIVFQKYNRGKLFEAMRLNKRDTYPQPKEFVYSYKRQREWKLYKQEVIEEVLRRKHERKNLHKWRSCDRDMSFLRKV
ncbi:cAMP-dependent protein kinase type I-alpha regulatory subunit-like [Dysidea avara]|uniref:cAMP-dependent protein kinase type I-alpha regulatory subunit-like n=1 Tax=Dysidea avara TaxID=196820 RepID=UPI003333BAFE